MKELLSGKEKTRLSLWLDSRYGFKLLDEKTVEIATPFLDNLNDSIMIYLQQQADGCYKITDDGFTVGNLQSLGYFVDKRYVEQVKSIMNINDVVITADELYMLVKEEDTPARLFQFASYLSTLSNSIASLHILEKEGR